MTKEFHIEHKISIAAPIEKVFAVLCDVEKWSEWTKSIKKTELITSGGFKVGAKIKIYQPRLLPAVWTVTEISQNRVIWTKDSPGLKVNATHILESTNDGTSFVNSITFEGFLAALVLQVSRSLTKKYIAMEANGLKNVCEAVK